MKKLIILFALLPILLSFSSPHKKQALSKYFFFSPQELQLKKANSTISTADIDKLEIYIIASLQESDSGSSSTTLSGNTPFTLRWAIDTSLMKHDEYKISLNASTLKLKAKNQRAMRYAIQTLKRLFDYYKSTDGYIPQFNIKDWADFQRRGYMLDISRDKVPTMKSLLLLVDQLAQWRFNELQLYTEHTFAYKNHKVVWQNASPMTAQQVRILDAYCRLKGIDLVPNQNSFGHMKKWLKHDEYRELAECETDCNTIWGKRNRNSLSPINPKSLALMQELYAELLPNFTSKYFNIGCDETVELCHGKSKEACERIGKGHVYLNFLLKLKDEVRKYGKQTMFWGDIILNHPELIPELPKDMIALVWGYGASYSFDENLKKFKKIRPGILCMSRHFHMALRNREE